MRFCSLGSGSEGNALLVECADGDRIVRLLVDCGFGLKEVNRRLECLGLQSGDIDALLVTHEHGDHVGGAYRLAAHANIKLYMTRGTMRGSAMLAKSFLEAGRSPHWIDPDCAFEVGGVMVMPVRVPHDALEPVQFVIDTGAARLGILTDLGHTSPHLGRMFTRLDALVLEANHDEQMLAKSDYPASLKRRIGGDYGHLSNKQAAAWLAGVDQSRLQTLAAAHLSQQNNTSELACHALAQASGRRIDEVLVAEQERGLAWIDVLQVQVQAV